MKRIALFIILVTLLLSNLAHAQQWERYATPPYPFILTNLSNIGNTVFLSTSLGLYRSSDAGDNWERIRDYSVSVLEVNRNNNRLYWAEGPDTTQFHKLYSSADLGNTWKLVGNLQAYISGFIGDTMYGFYQKGVGSKVDNNNWKPVVHFPKDTAGLLLNMCADGQHLWVATQKGIFHSPDAGYHWEMSVQFPVAPVDDPSNNVFQRLNALHGEVLFVHQKLSKLYYSNDFGQTWQIIPWKYRQLYSSSEHLYTTSPSVTELYRFEGGGPEQWTKLSFEAVDPIGLADVCEYEGTNWIGISGGVFRKKSDSEQWLPSNGPSTIEDSYFPSFIDGHLFMNNARQTFSEDNGNSWKQNLSTIFPKTHWQDDTYNYTISSFQYSPTIWACPRNNRFFWKAQATTPDNITAGIADGDTLWGFKQGPIQPYQTYVSYDRGKTWPKTFPLPVSGTKTFVRRFKHKLYLVKDKSLLRSEDHGASWQTVYTFPHTVSDTYGRFYVVRDTLLISYSPLDRIYYSADGGQTFDTLQVPQNPNSSTFRLLHYDGLLMLNQGGSTVYLSRDIGKTWTSTSLPSGVGFNLIEANESWGYGNNTLFVYNSWRLRLDALREVRGKVFLDLNGNGKKDNDEAGLNEWVLHSAKDGVLGATYNDGDFSVLVGQNDDEISVVNLPPHYVAAPGAAAIAGGTGNIPPVTFAIQPQGMIHDAAVKMVAAAQFRGGYDNTLYVNIENAGTIPASGQLKWVPDPLLTLSSATPSPDVQSGDTLIWNYTNLGPLKKRKIQLTVKTAVSPPGTPLSVWAKIENASDVNPANNTVELKEEVVSSYDPNDKKVSATQIPLNTVEDEELVYTIRFQNLGNIETDFITVRDTLSAALDASSVRVTASSHLYQLRIEDGHILVFRFNPIRLSPAQLDSVRSQGFVQFSVRIKPGLKVGDEIANTAHIYFDFNPAVVTNTALSAITIVSTTFEPSRLAVSLQIFPNPSAAQVTLRLPEGTKGAGQIALFSPEGRLVYTTTAKNREQILDVTAYPAGAYWCRWHTEETTYWGKLVIEH